MKNVLELCNGLRIRSLYNDKDLFKILVRDYYYYNKLLLGSVEHAKKFDGALFDGASNKSLTASISDEVSSRWSNLCVILFYLVPTLPVLGFLCVSK